MTFHVHGPGKTAPLLYNNFLAFDPVCGRPNVLADFTPPHGEGPQLAAPLQSCKHEYVTKTEQSVPPPLNLRPDGTTIYKLAAICKKCRMHAEIHIDHAKSTDPCGPGSSSGSEHPLHHFQRVDTYDQKTFDRIQYAWQCSVRECLASLFIIYRKPRLDSDDIQLLTNPELLKRRYEEVVQDDPGRDGVKEATPMDALSRMRRYIKDSLVPRESKKQIPANNKRFQEAYGILGRDCEDLLNQLGFKLVDGFWVLPNPDPIDDRIRADSSTLREQLEDVELELFMHMNRLAAERGMLNPHATEVFSSADRDIERTLGAQGYTRFIQSRRTTSSNESIPFFTSLGALPDFSDSLIEYSFDRQVECDPSLWAYYFECLQVVLETRDSEQLQMKVAKLQSQDFVSRRDLSAAYRSLNITPVEAKTITDERIIDRYQAQQSDLSASAQEELRGHLYKIGISRNSALLQNASRQSVDTYEDALSWLGNGVTKDTPDESLLAVLAMKTAESKSNEEIGQKAISVIARARQSNYLNNWLATGTQDGYAMTIEDALRHLNIDQSLAQVDQTILPVLFDSARQDRPGEQTEKAISTIQSALAAGNGYTKMHPPETWPVGLTSHGNTCYLNSLLQYYFSIKPLRDLVLDYDQYKLDMSQHDGKEGRVGQRKINPIEIQGGQKFAAELKHLFERMIKSRDSAVKPEADLVCRAFLPPMEYRALGTIINTDKPKDATANGTDSSAIDEKMTDGEVLASPVTTNDDERKESDASSATLQASVNGESKDVPMKDAELPPTPPGSPGPNGQEKAPPLPPRRFSTTKQDALAKAEENARNQQDVSEVHDAITFLLRCGLDPRGYDESGEQEDIFRDLFSVRLSQTPVKDGVEQKPQLIYDSAIPVAVPEEPTDIYSALDQVFDLQTYGNDSSIEAYKSIEGLPPLLQIQIPRINFQLGRAGGAAYKSTECVSLKDELYLDRYLRTGAEDLLPKRRQCWGWRRQLQALKREQKVLSKTPIDLDGPTTMSQTAEYLASLDTVNRDLDFIGISSIEADGDITTALTTEATEQATRLAALSNEIEVLQKQLNAQFEEMKKVKYRLAAVFFHRGSYGHGHYWIYIHDFANDLWRLYNDETVEEYTKLESIFEAKTWDQGTPTYAVYVAEDRLDFVQAVCRDPEPAPPEPEQLEQPVGGSGLTFAKSQQDSAQGIDPKLVTEGGDKVWDDERTVGNNGW